MAKFDVFDLETGDLVGWSNSLDEALALVAEMVRDEPSAIDSTVIAGIDRRGRRKSELWGDGLRLALVEIEPGLVATL